MNISFHLLPTDSELYQNTEIYAELQSTLTLSAVITSGQVKS